MWGVWTHRWSPNTLTCAVPLPTGDGAPPPTPPPPGCAPECVGGGGSGQTYPAAQFFPGIPPYGLWSARAADQIWPGVEGNCAGKGIGGPSMGPHTPHTPILTPIPTQAPTPTTPTSERKGVGGYRPFPPPQVMGPGGWSTQGVSGYPMGPLPASRLAGLGSPTLLSTPLQLHFK